MIYFTSFSATLVDAQLANLPDMTQNPIVGHMFTTHNHLALVKTLDHYYVIHHAYPPDCFAWDLEGWWRIGAPRTLLFFFVHFRILVGPHCWHFDDGHPGRNVP
jgi:hypothetical protein